jgi:hypothetical protein
LIAAYLDAGWTGRAVAEAMGRTVHTIGDHDRAARAHPQPTHPAIPVPPQPKPPQRPARPRLDELDWLRPSQAAELMGVHVNQLCTWRRAGLLSNARTTRAGHNRYPRSDLLHLVRLRDGRKILPPNTAARHGDPDTGRRHAAAVPRKLTERHHRARTTTPPTPRRATQVDAPARCGRDAVARPE